MKIIRRGENTQRVFDFYDIQKSESKIVEIWTLFRNDLKTDATGMMVYFLQIWHTINNIYSWKYDNTINEI